MQFFKNGIICATIPLPNGKVSSISFHLLLKKGDIFSSKNLEGIGVEYSYSILEA